MLKSQHPIQLKYSIFISQAQQGNVKAYLIFVTTITIGKRKKLLDVARTKCVVLQKVCKGKVPKNKNTKCPKDAHCHRNCRKDLKITKDCTYFPFLGFLKNLHILSPLK